MASFCPESDTRVSPPASPGGRESKGFGPSCSPPSAGNGRSPMPKTVSQPVTPATRPADSASTPAKTHLERRSFMPARPRKSPRHGPPYRPRSRERRHPERARLFFPVATVGRDEKKDQPGRGQRAARRERDVGDLCLVVGGGGLGARERPGRA